MSHGRHTKPSPALKALRTTGPLVASGAAVGVLLTAGHPVGGGVTTSATQELPKLTEANLDSFTAPAKPTFTPKEYTVRLGNTLSGIAAKQCRNSNDWPGIYDANKKIIGSNPNLIRVGQKIEVVCEPQAKLPDPPAKIDAQFAKTANTGSLQSQIERLGYTSSEAYTMAYTALFLYRDGYSAAGAAGVVSCIAGESAGNVESVGDGGGGLIGWTPLPYGMVTGNYSHDLNTQLAALLHYNNVNGPTGELKSQTNPYSAADFYSQHFERPAVTDSDVRYSVAEVVYHNLP